MLKLDSGAQVLQAQAMLLKVFMMIGGRQTSEYISALTASLLLCGHYETCERCDHPCWHLFKNNSSAFNEESGEIALSVLLATSREAGSGAT